MFGEYVKPQILPDDAFSGSNDGPPEAPASSCDHAPNG